MVALRFKGPGFDLIRITAATTVLLHHASGIGGGDITHDVLFRYSGGFMQFGLLAVIVFFAISGFLVTPGLARSGSITAFAASRVTRIFPALVIVVLLTMGVLGPMLTSDTLRAYLHDPLTWKYLKNVLTLTVNPLPGVVVDGQPAVVNGALWTLHFEILSYAALGLLAAIGLLRRRGVFLGLFAATYAAYVLLGLRPDLAAALPARATTFIALFVYFAAGATLSLFSNHVPFSRSLAAAAFALLMLAMPMGLGLVAMPLCLPYLVVFCGLSALPGRALVKKDLSYGVYLMHAAVLTAFEVCFPQFRIWWLAALAILTVTLVLAWLSWTFVEGPALRHKKLLAAWLASGPGFRAKVQRV